MLEQIVIACIPTVIAIFTFWRLYRKEPTWLKPYLESAKEFLIPQEEGQPSPLALFIDTIADRFALRMRMGILGEKSGNKRLETALMKDAVGDIMNRESPLLAMALDEFFPSWKRRLAKNPQALPSILNLAGQFLGNTGMLGTAWQGGTKGKNLSFAERLKKYRS